MPPGKQTRAAVTAQSPSCGQKGTCQCRDSALTHPGRAALKVHRHGKQQTDGPECFRPLCLPAQHAKLAANEHVQHVLALVCNFIRIVLSSYNVPGRAKLLV